MNGIIKNFRRYIPLLRELVSRDLTKKYRRSLLGYLWSLLNPLLMMLVVSSVFSFIFRNNIENYPIYLIIGQTFFNFYSESTNHAMTALIDSSPLLQKVYIPKYIFPLAKVLSSFVNLLYSLVAIVIVLLFTRTPVKPTITMFPLGLLYLLLFCIGMSLVLSILTVYFRDMLHLYKVMLTAWMYLTPIFYSIEAISPVMARIVMLNPMYAYITFFRKIILYGEMPSLIYHAVCLGWGIVTLVLGILFFKKRQDGVILHI